MANRVLSIPNGHAPIVETKFDVGEMVAYGKEVLRVWEQHGEDVLCYNERGMIRVIPVGVLELKS